MTGLEAYKEHIQYSHNAFCKRVIRHAAIDKSLKLRRKWRRIPVSKRHWFETVQSKEVKRIGRIPHIQKG